LHGSWEIPGSPESSQCSRDASGSPRIKADDERTREVGQTHSTGEVSEQGRSFGGGGDGGKGSGQGNLSSKTRPGLRAGATRQCAGAGTTGGKREQGCEVHRSAAPHLPDRHPAFAYSQLKRQAAPGVDGETWRHYGEALEEKPPESLHRLKRGAYRAKPVRRVYIPRRMGGSGRSASRRSKTRSSNERRWKC